MNTLKMSVYLLFLVTTVILADDYDGHISFGEHFANGVSTIQHYNNRQGCINVLFVII